MGRDCEKFYSIWLRVLILSGTKEVQKTSVWKKYVQDQSECRGLVVIMKHVVLVPTIDIRWTLALPTIVFIPSSLATENYSTVAISSNCILSLIAQVTCLSPSMTFSSSSA